MNSQSPWSELIEKHLGDSVRIKREVPADTITTFALGGPLELMVEPQDLPALRKLLEILFEERIPWRMLGRGSNIVLPDRGISDVIIHLGREFEGFMPVEQGPLAEDELAELLNKLSGSTQASEIDLDSLPSAPKAGDKVYFLALGGAPLMTLSRKLSSLGLSGLEFAAGIPGSLGGAVKMNAGAHEHCMEEVVRKACVLSRVGDLEVRSHEQLDFSYRNSSVKSGQIVVGAELCLVAKPKKEVSKLRSSCLDYRKKTQPLQSPSAGSVFRNPSVEEWREASSGKTGLPEDPPSAAWLLEQVGLKGKCRGGVGFSELHANWLVKVEDTAMSADVGFLVAEAQTRVEEAYSLRLIPEIVMW